MKHSSNYETFVVLRFFLSFVQFSSFFRQHATIIDKLRTHKKKYVTQRDEEWTTKREEEEEGGWMQKSLTTIIKSINNKSKIFMK